MHASIGLQTGNVLEAWIPVGAALTGIVALLGAAITFLRFMRSQESKIDALGSDLKSNQANLHNELAALRAEMNHKFERLDDKNQSYVRHREFLGWIERLREANPDMKIPSVFGGGD